MWQNGVSFRLFALLFLNLFVLPDLALTASLPKPGSRAVIANGGALGAAKANALPMKACPTTLFTFKSPLWDTTNTVFTAFIAGRDFVGDVRICRFRRWTVNGNFEYAYGFEYSNGKEYRCISNFASDNVTVTAIAPPESAYPTQNAEENTSRRKKTKRSIDSANYYGVNSKSAEVGEYDVLYVPKSVSTDWVTQKSFPKFPSLNPAPMTMQVDSTTNAYLARCRITVDNNNDPSIVISIPGIIFSYASDQSTLEVSYNGVDYRCDQEDLEFPVCI